MGNPKVTVQLGANNLGVIGADASGTFGIIAAIPAANTTGLGIPVLIKSKKQAETELSNPANADVLKAITNGFYGEIADGAPLYCLFVANTVTLAQMADTANNYVSTLHNFSAKQIRAISFVRFAPTGYSPTIFGGFDKDVHDCVVKAQQQANAAIAANKHLEFIVEGKSFTNAVAAKNYAVTNNKNVHIVIGAENGNSATPVLRALGKKAANAVHRNIGRVRSGSLKIAEDVIVTMGSNISITTPETKATATVTIAAVGGLYIGITEPYTNTNIWLALYNYNAANDTPTKQATAIVALINAGTASHGYSATRTAEVITITAKAGLGAAINGTNLLVLNYGTGNATSTAFTAGVDAVINILTAKPIAEIDAVDLDDLHNKRYINYIINEDAPGYIFNDDNSLCDAASDYASWGRNAVIGEAARIAYAEYYRTLKDDVDVTDEGELPTVTAKALEQTVEDAINEQIGTNISNVSALVNPDTVQFAGLYENANITNPNINLLAGGKIYVFTSVRPRGYIKDILVVLGFGLN